MRLLIQAVSAPEREAPVAPPSLHVSLPRVRRRAIVGAVGMAAGAALWVLYLYSMIHSTNPLIYVVFGAVGAACGLALVRIPVLMWDFVRKQGYQIALRQWTDKSRVLASAARRTLREADLAHDPQAANDLAVVDFLQGDPAGAAAGFEAAAAGGVSEAPANLLAALAESGQWDQIARQVQSVPRIETLTTETNLARLGARARDEQLLERLWKLAQERRQALLLNNLGVRALRRRQYPQAERALQAAAQARPGYAYAHANLAVLAYRRGQLPQAVPEAASAAGLVAEDERVFANLGALLAAAGDLRKARTWLLKAHKLQPRDPAVLINLGNVYSQDGEDEAAVAALHAAALHADDGTARYDLGLHHYHGARYTAALEEWLPALEHAPDDRDLLTSIGCALFQQGQCADAYEYFTRVAATGGDPVCRRNLIRAELAAGRQIEAAALIEEGHDGDGLDLERGLMHLLRAMAIKPETTTHRQMLEFNLNAAAAAFTRALSAGQTAATEAQLNYGLTQYLRGEHVSAAETFAQTLRKGANHAEMTYLTGQCYIMAALREREEHEVRDDTPPPAVRELFLKGRPYLEKAVNVQSVAEVAAYDLGLLNYMVGDYQRAIDVLRKITRPDSPVHVVNTLALAQAKLAQDLQLTAQTATLMPEGRKQETRAQARQLLAAAIHYFKQALAIEPLAPLTHANMGLALMLRNQKGDVEAALEHWQLMHEHGDARHRRTYEQFMQVMSPEGAHRLRFQDVELSFHRVNVREWVVFPQPRPAGFRYVVRELLDEPEWQLQAGHRLVRRALAYRQKAERMRRKLRRLAI